MGNPKEVEATCDWCLQEAPVQTIQEKLWHFWKIISTEDRTMTSHKNICGKCKSRYEGFAIYIERCKINKSKVDELLLTGQVKDEPSLDIEYPSLLKSAVISKEVDSNCFHPAVLSGVLYERQVLAGCSNAPMKSNDSTIDKVLSAGKVKKELFIDIEDHLINEQDVWTKEEVYDPDYPTVSGGKGTDSLVLRVVLERQILPDSMVLQKKFMCTYCGKTFNYPCDLKVHLRTHTCEKRFKCSHCNKSFTRRGHLIQHLRIHTGDKPFKCSHCKKSFTVSYNLNVHLRTHTGEKRFKCTHCNKRFAHSNTLNIHLRTHTGEKPYECTHCNKRFAQLSTLINHLRTHTGEKPFECSHCKKSFAQPSHLKVHLRIHTGD